MEDEIAARNPFAALYKSLSDLEKAKTEYVNSLSDWKAAQDELKDADTEFIAALEAKTRFSHRLITGNSPRTATN